MSVFLLKLVLFAKTEYCLYIGHLAFESANEMFFIAEFERAAKNQEDCSLPFLNISSSSRVIKVKMSSFRSKSAPKSCQDQ